MILLADVTHYTVDGKTFDAPVIVTDQHGNRHLRSRYYLAREESLATGLPIVAHGLNSERDGKNWVHAPKPSAVKQFDTPEQVLSLVMNA